MALGSNCLELLIIYGVKALLPRHKKNTFVSYSLFTHLSSHWAGIVALINFPGFGIIKNKGFSLLQSWPLFMFPCKIQVVL